MHVTLVLGAVYLLGRFCVVVLRGAALTCALQHINGTQAQSSTADARTGFVPSYVVAILAANAANVRHRDERNERRPHSTVTTGLVASRRQVLLIRFVVGFVRRHAEGKYFRDVPVCVCGCACVLGGMGENGVS